MSSESSAPPVSTEASRSTNSKAMTPIPATRPQGSRLFSPRSTAALALSSISQPLRTEGANDAENNPNGINNAENSNTDTMVNQQAQIEKETNTTEVPKSHGETTPPEAHSNLYPPHHYHDPHQEHHHHHHNGQPLPHASYPDYKQPNYHHPPSYQNKKTGSPNLDHYGSQREGRWWPAQPPPGQYYMMPPPPPPHHHHQGRHHPSYPTYPPGPYGHMPMDPRMSHYPPPPPPPPMMGPSGSKSYHERTWASLTPEGKRLKPSKDDASYNRKLKSLGVLAEAFVGKHKDLPGNTSVVVDDMARMLGVERRRIYDVVNILESVGVVIKKSKNTYVWMGMEVMVANLGELQEEAIGRYPDDALEAGLIAPEECAKYKACPPPAESIHHKTLNRLTQQFLHVFLVGHKTMSLPEASDKIHGSSSTMFELAKLGGWDGVDDGTGLAMHKAASKGLKTKIRRLYDVSNVLFHLNWVVKLSPAIHQPKLQNDIAPLLLERRPQYKWNYEMSPQQLRTSFLQSKSRPEYRDSSQQMSHAGAPTYQPQTSAHHYEHHHPQQPQHHHQTTTNMNFPITRRVSLEDDRPGMDPMNSLSRRISMDMSNSSNNKNIPI